MPNLYYFGTSLWEKGHFHYWLDGKGFNRYATHIPRFEDVPFNPYFIKNKPKGAGYFAQFYGFTLLAFSGSPIDARGGTVSVFYIREIMNKDEFISFLKKNEMAVQVMSKISVNLNEV